MQDIVKFISKRVNIRLYSSDYDYCKEQNSEWVWNIANSLIQNSFLKFIQVKEDKRREELLISNNLDMKVLPKFLGIFKSSQDITIVRGKSHFLTRDPKTTKYKLEMQLLKEQRRK